MNEERDESLMSLLDEMSDEIGEAIGENSGVYRLFHSEVAVRLRRIDYWQIRPLVEIEEEEEESTFHSFLVPRDVEVIDYNDDVEFASHIMSDAPLLSGDDVEDIKTMSEKELYSITFADMAELAALDVRFRIHDYESIRELYRDLEVYITVIETHKRIDPCIPPPPEEDMMKFNILYKKLTPIIEAMRSGIYNPDTLTEIFFGMAKRVQGASTGIVQVKEPKLNGRGLTPREIAESRATGFNSPYVIGEEDDDKHWLD